MMKQSEADGHGGVCPSKDLIKNKYEQLSRDFINKARENDFSIKLYDGIRKISSLKTKLSKKDIINHSKNYITNFPNIIKNSKKFKVSILCLSSILCLNNFRLMTTNLINNRVQLNNDDHCEQIDSSRLSDTQINNLFYCIKQQKIRELSDVKIIDQDNKKNDKNNKVVKEDTKKDVKDTKNTKSDKSDKKEVKETKEVKNEISKKEDKLVSKNIIKGKKENISDREETFKGIDVSSHQRKIDWETTKKYIDYAIIRVCDFYNKDSNGKPLIDSQFYYNIKECNRLGIPVGVYSYSRANNKEEAIKEAKFVLNAIKNYKLDYPVYFDIECEKHQNMIYTDLNKAIEITEAYCETIEKSNYYVGIYSSNDIINNLTNNKRLAKYDKWIANFGADREQNYKDVHPKKVIYDDVYFMHQASSKAHVPGIQTCVDVDFGYQDFKEIIENAELNIPKTKTR